MTSATHTKALLAWLALGIASVAPALAGAVYVPVASNTTFEGRIYETRVWVSNPSNEVREFRTLFIPSLSDGLAPDRNLLPFQQVTPHSTILLSDFVPIGETGMLEIDADAELVFGSALVPRVGDVELPRARVPLVSSSNLIPADGMAELLALSRTSAGTISNVGIVNFGDETTSCTARVFLRNGARVGGTAILVVPPRSHQQFSDALGLLGLQDVDDVRVEISCNQDFFAYATVFGMDPEETLFVQPSTSGASQLRAPGVAPPITEFRQGGEFLRASRNDPSRLFRLPVEPGEQLSRIEVEFDFRFGGFNADLFHTMTSLRSNGLYFAVTLRGDNSRTFLDTIDSSARATGPWKKNRTYHILIVFDVVENLSSMEVREHGSVVLELVGTADRQELGNLDGSLRLDFSQSKVFDDAFFPLWGSTYSNLEVRLFHPE